MISPTVSEQEPRMHLHPKSTGRATMPEKAPEKQSWGRA